MSDRLTSALYTDFLEAALARGVRFVRFDELGRGATFDGRRIVALRHDIDFAPEHSLAMAELEHEHGVAATYFALVDGHFYNPLDPDVVRILRRIHALGHEVGLHFAVADAALDDLGEEVAFRLEVLAAIVGAPVRSFSQHDPVNAGFAAVALPPGHPPCVDAYRAIDDHGLLYVSDSAMRWREHTFHTALDEDRDLCLLAHPHSWMHDGDDYVAMIRGFGAAEVAGVERRYGDFVVGLEGYFQRRDAEGPGHR